MIGLSSKVDRDSNSVARYLQKAGYRIIPVNPHEDEVLGERSYASLRDVPGSVDIVDVFRRAEHTPPVAREAVEAGAKVLWLQLGIRNEESRRIAQEGGSNTSRTPASARFTRWRWAEAGSRPPR